ncbi:IS3 family transposase, partial [Leptospira borgpetersenii]
NQYHLEKKLEEFIHFYNNHRTHLALNKDSPVLNWLFALSALPSIPAIWYP